MKNKNLISFSIFYILIYVAIAMPFGFMQTFLESVGYDVLQRGIILSGSAIIAIVSQFVIGYICDKYKTIKIPFNITLILMVISTLFMYEVTEKNFFIHLIFVSLMAGLFRTICVIQDAWVLEVDENCKKNYGAIRAFGAIGWIIGITIGGKIILNYNYRFLGYVFTFVTLICIFYSMTLEKAKKIGSKEKIKFKDLKRLFQNKEYILVVIIFFFINMIMTVDGYSSIDKMMLLNANEDLIALRWSIQALTELPLFFMGAFLLRKFNDKKLTIFGTFMYIVRFICYYFAQTPNQMILATLFQMVTFPVVVITSKTLVDKASPIDLKTSGQTVASAIYAGIPLLLAPIISGILITLFSIDIAILIIGLSGIIPLILSLKLKNS